MPAGEGGEEEDDGGGEEEGDESADIYEPSEGESGGVRMSGLHGWGGGFFFFLET